MDAMLFQHRQKSRSKSNTYADHDDNELFGDPGHKVLLSFFEYLGLEQVEIETLVLPDKRLFLLPLRSLARLLQLDHGALHRDSALSPQVAYHLLHFLRGFHWDLRGWEVRYVFHKFRRVGITEPTTCLIIDVLIGSSIARDTT